MSPCFSKKCPYFLTLSDTSADICLDRGCLELKHFGSDLAQNRPSSANVIRNFAKLGLVWANIGACQARARAPAHLWRGGAPRPTRRLLAPAAWLRSRWSGPGPPFPRWGTELCDGGNTCARLGGELWVSSLEEPFGPSLLEVDQGVAGEVRGRSPRMRPESASQSSGYDEHWCHRNLGPNSVLA